MINYVHTYSLHNKAPNGKLSFSKRFQLADNIVIDILYEFGRFRVTTNVASVEMINSDGLRDRIFDQFRVLVEPQIVQHVHRRTQKRSRISQILAHHAGASIMSAHFENGVFIADVQARN